MFILTHDKVNSFVKEVISKGMHALPQNSVGNDSLVFAISRSAFLFNAICLQNTVALSELYHIPVVPQIFLVLFLLFHELQC